MQVTTAAVTTTLEGNVFNVFRVRSNNNDTAISPQQLQQTLFRKLLLDT